MGQSQTKDDDYKKQYRKNIRQQGRRDSIASMPGDDRPPLAPTGSMPTTPFSQPQGAPAFSDSVAADRSQSGRSPSVRRATSQPMQYIPANSAMLPAAVAAQPGQQQMVLVPASQVMQQQVSATSSPNRDRSIPNPAVSFLPRSSFSGVVPQQLQQHAAAAAAATAAAQQSHQQSPIPEPGAAFVVAMKHIERSEDEERQSLVTFEAELYSNLARLQVEMATATAHNATLHKTLAKVDGQLSALTVTPATSFIDQSGTFGDRSFRGTPGAPREYDYDDRRRSDSYYRSDVPPAPTAPTSRPPAPPMPSVLSSRALRSNSQRSLNGFVSGSDADFADRRERERRDFEDRERQARDRQRELERDQMERQRQREREDRERSRYDAAQDRLFASDTPAPLQEPRPHRHALPRSGSIPSSEHAGREALSPVTKDSALRSSRDSTLLGLGASSSPFKPHAPGSPGRDEAYAAPAATRRDPYSVDYAVSAPDPAVVDRGPGSYTYSRPSQPVPSSYTSFPTASPSPFLPSRSPRADVDHSRDALVATPRHNAEPPAASYTPIDPRAVRADSHDALSGRLAAIRQFR